MTSTLPSLNELRNAPRTNKDSKFEDITVKLDNGATLSGLFLNPKEHITPEEAIPLVVLIHGATCSSAVWDISPELSTTVAAEKLQVPILAIDRPNYGGSEGWMKRSSDGNHFPATPDLTYFEEEARWYHDLIFPALWTDFALPNGFSSLVTISHSMPVPPTIIAAGHYAQTTQSERRYKWAGMVLYGFADVPTQTIASSGANSTAAGSSLPLPLGYDASLHVPPFTTDDYLALLCGPEELRFPAYNELLPKQQTPFNAGEPANVFGEWSGQKDKYKKRVTMPILHALGEYDFVWVGDRANVDAFCAGFTQAERVEGAVVKGTGHTINLSRYGGEAWWGRVMHWACEVSAGEPVAEMGLEHYS